MPKEGKKPRQHTCRQCAHPTKWEIHRGQEPLQVTFPTTDGLDKHLREEHRSQMFTCTAVGCFKGNSAPKFQKGETLTQHIKESHNADVDFHCPIETCGFGPSKIDDLAVHAHWGHTSNEWGFGLRVKWVISPFANAASWMYFRCPVWNCRKLGSNSCQKVAVHLASHSDIEIQGVKDQLMQDGYEIRNPSRGVDTTGGDQASVIQIVCPACGTRCESDTKFKDHLAASHILAATPGTMKHFKAWREDIISWSVSCTIKNNIKLPCWKERSFQGLRTRGRKRSPYECSACSFKVREDGDRNEHPSLLRPVEDVITELLSHRMSIVRHYPDFITHPVFERLVQPASN